MPISLPPQWRSLLKNPQKLQAAAQAFAGTVLLTGVVVSGVMLTLRQLGVLQSMELATYDHLMRRQPDPGLDDRLLVVGVSEQDIQTLNEFPIHDSTLAEALANLESHDPLAIGIDIGRDVPQGDGREALTEIIAGSDRIITICVMSAADDPGLPPAPGTPIERTAFADLPQDPGGIVRRSIVVSVPLAPDAPPPSEHVCNDSNPDNQLVSFSFLLAMNYLGTQGIVPELTESGEILLGDAVLHRLDERAGGYHHPGVEDYQILLNYRSANNAVRVVDLVDVLNDDVDPAWIENKIVLMGYVSEIAKDIFYTPFSGGAEDRAMPGVVVHAQATSQLISAALGERPLLTYWAGWQEGGWIILWSFVGGTIAYIGRRWWVFLLGEGVAILILYGIVYSLFSNGVWIPLWPPIITLLATGVGVVLVDRANKGGYTQAVYEQVRDQVKGILKPTIEIDEEKRAKQVAEITDTGYFQDLMSRAKAIREQRAAMEKQEENQD